MDLRRGQTNWNAVLHLAHFSDVLFRRLDPIDTTTKITAPRMTASNARTPRPVATPREFTSNYREITTKYDSPIIGNDKAGNPLWVAISRG